MAGGVSCSNVEPVLEPKSSRPDVHTTINCTPTSQSTSCFKVGNKTQEINETGPKGGWEDKGPRAYLKTHTWAHAGLMLLFSLILELELHWDQTPVKTTLNATR